MSLSFGSSGNAGGAGGLITQGADLEVIQTEGLGFRTVAGDAKVQLTPGWSPLPAPTASLMSIASRKGLVAAAGPDGVYIATTDSVRKTFDAPKPGTSEVRPFEPQAKLALPMRISQLFFTADEQYLILSAESGGGLAVYDVEALKNGSSQSAFELSTNGETLRHLIPNPMPELSAFCALVTNNGSLMMANLQERAIVTGPNGTTLLNQVTCAAWSTKGKQLVAGRGDGTICQITPDGTEKGVFPKPPGLGDCHVSSITWLENHVLLAVHTAANQQEGSVYHIITRQQQAGASAPPPSFTFQKLVDPVEPYVLAKVAHHTILRLHQFPPNLDELLIVASTAIESIGLMTKSKTPLASDQPADTITNVFTTTELADDSKRAQLPIAEDMSDTFPIGVALDLSSKDKVYKPIPTDEIDESPGPLPGLWVLSNDGVLSAWWVVYNESIRSGQTYPGLAAVANPAGAQAPAQNPFGSSTASQPTTFGGAASTSTPSAFGAPAAAKPNPFASSAAGSSTFGAPTPAAPAFGGTSVLGAKVNPWASPAKPSAPAFGASSFGSSSPAPAATEAPKPKFGDPTFGLANTSRAPAPAFGQSAALGAKPNPWASGSTSAAAKPAFGQSSFGTAAASPGNNKVFGSASTSTPSAGGGFSAFANKPTGFGAIASAGSPSIFGKPAGDSPSAFGKPSGGAATSMFGQPSGDSSSVFGRPSGNAAPSIFGKPAGSAAPSSKEVSMDNDTAFPPPTSKPQGGSTLGSSPFVLGSTFKPDPKTANDNEDTKPAGGSSLFGSGFLDLSSASKKVSFKPEDYKTPVTEKPKSVFESTTPTTTPGPQTFGFKSTSGPSASGGFGNSVFGQPMPPPATFANPFAPKPKAPGEPEIESSSEDEFSESDELEFVRDRDIKDEEDSEEDKENLAKIPEAPFSPPPDTTSKAAFPSPGGSPPSPVGSSFLFVAGSRSPSSSPKGNDEDAPLPPDFLSPKSTKSSASPKAEEAPLPPDFLQTIKKSPGTIPMAAPLPPDFLPTKSEKELETTEARTPEAAPLPPDFLVSEKSTTSLTVLPEVPDTTEEDELTEEGELSDDGASSEDKDAEEDEVDEDEDEDEGVEAGTEGSGVDVGKEFSPDNTYALNSGAAGVNQSTTPGFTPYSSFEGMGGSTFSSFSKPEPPQHPLFGEISRNAPQLDPFRPPVHSSPRSPSPVRRGAIPPNLQRPEQSRSVSAPGIASQILGKQPVKPQQPMQGQGATGFQKVGKASFMLDPNVEEQRRAQAKKEEEEAQKLRDPEDEGMRQILEADIEPTLRLDAFVAADSVLADLEIRQKEPIGSQCETLWRDLNRMVDLLGLNSRSLEAFIQGHATSYSEKGRTKEDLEIPDDWVLCEAEDLGVLVESDLSTELEASRVKDMDNTHSEIRAIMRELSKLRAKQEDMHKIIMSYVDPGQVAITKSLPLSAEQATQRNEMRRTYANLIKLLSEAEESLTLLRTKIASTRGPSRKTGAPTVDAVIRTIGKLTSMAEKRSGDVDVLEAQLRKLRLATPGSRSPTPATGSRESSPFIAGAGAGSSPRKTPLRRSVFMSSGTFRDSFSSSVGAGGPSPRKKMSMYTEEERKTVLSKHGKRKAKLGMLRDSLERAGPHVSTLEDK